LASQDRGSRAGVEADLAGVRLVEAGKDSQERRLARAIGADEADALAGLQLETDFAKERVGVKGAGKVGAAE
jgi:hypothetical protein